MAATLPTPGGDVNAWGTELNAYLRSIYTSVQDKGAAGDGTTDDTTAIQSAITDSGQRGVVYFPPGEYRITSTLTVQHNEKSLWGYGAQITSDFSGTAIQVGAQGAIYQRIRVFGLRIVRSSTDWTANNIGLLFLNTAYCSATDFSVTGFREGIELRGTNGNDQLYFRGMPHSIWGCLYPIYIYAQGTGSAVNENWFFGGSLKFTTGNPDASTGYGVWIGTDGVANDPNNLKFYGLSLECQTPVSPKPAGAIRAHCIDSVFHHLRYEGFTSPFVKGTVTANGNRFVGGSGLSLADVDLATMGTDNFVSADDAEHMAGNLRMVGNLGVGNSAAAGTGTSGDYIKNKIEVFDENGNSLGFIAAYNAIT